MCCKPLKLKVRGQGCRRRSWSNDKEKLEVLELQNNKTAEEVKKEVNKEVTKEKMLRLRIVYVRKTQMRNQAIRLAIETE